VGCSTEDSQPGSMAGVPMNVSRLTYTLDCSDGQRLSGFWAEVLGYSVFGPHRNHWSLIPPEGVQEPWFILQQVGEPKSGKNRMHVDIHVADLDGEVQRIVALGAQRVSEEPYDMEGFTWFVMADPEGNEFCIVGLPEAHRPSESN
jgi:predicted enzyme related to lactoylglutathione lyase